MWEGTGWNGTTVARSKLFVAKAGRDRASNQRTITASPFPCRLTSCAGELSLLLCLQVKVRALYIHRAERGVWNAPCNARRYICRGEILLCPPDKWVDRPGREENSAKHSGQVGRAGNITFPFSGRVWNCLGTSSARVAMWPLNRRSGVMIL